MQVGRQRPAAKIWEATCSRRPASCRWQFEHSRPTRVCAPSPWLPTACSPESFASGTEEHGVLCSVVVYALACLVARCSASDCASAVGVCEM